MKKHHVRHEILHEHELWANKVGTVITGVFGQVYFNRCFGFVRVSYDHYHGRG